MGIDYSAPDAALERRRNAARAAGHIRAGDWALAQRRADVRLYQRGEVAAQETARGALAYRLNGAGALRRMGLRGAARIEIGEVRRKRAIWPWSRLPV